MLALRTRLNCRIGLAMLRLLVSVQDYIGRIKADDSALELMADTWLDAASISLCVSSKSHSVPLVEPAMCDVRETEHVGMQDACAVDWMPRPQTSRNECKAQASCNSS